MYNKAQEIQVQLLIVMCNVQTCGTASSKQHLDFGTSRLKTDANLTITIRFLQQHLSEYVLACQKQHGSQGIKKFLMLIIQV